MNRLSTPSRWRFGILALVVSASPSLFVSAQPPPPPPALQGGLDALGGADLTDARLAALLPPPQHHCWSAAPAQAMAEPLAGAGRTPGPARRFRACFAAQGGLPAHPQIAAGRTHLVVTNQTQIAFHQKDGRYLGSLAAAAFFSPLGLDDGSRDGLDAYGGLQVIHDGHRQRFWIGAIASNGREPDPDKRHTVFVLAVSKSANPRSGWFLYWWPAEAIGTPDDRLPGDRAVDPSLGIDSVWIHQANGVVNGGERRYWRIASFPAALLVKGAAGPVRGRQYWNLRNPEGTPAWAVRPVIQHDAGPPGGRAYYVGRQRNGRDTVVWTLAPEPATAPGLRLSREAAVNSTVCLAPVNPRQPGSPQRLDMASPWLDVLKAVVRRNRMYVVSNEGKLSDPSDDGQETLTAVRLLELDLDAHPPTAQRVIFGQHNAADDGGSLVHYGWPSVEVNRAGWITVVYTRSGATVLPEARFSASFKTTDRFRDSSVLKAGEAPYVIPGNAAPVLPWGRGGGASVDPADDGVWMAHQAASLSRGPAGNYEIWVAKVVLPPPPAGAAFRGSGRSALPLLDPPGEDQPCIRDNWGGGH